MDKIRRWGALGILKGALGEYHIYVLMDTHVCRAGFITLRHLKGVSPTYIERQTFKYAFEICENFVFVIIGIYDV